MTLNKTKFSTYALILSIATPVILFTYGQIRAAMRPDLDCAPNTDCIDLRGLNELPYIFAMWFLLGIAAVVLSVYAIKANESKGRLALRVSIVSAAMPLVLGFIGVVTN